MEEANAVLLNALLAKKRSMVMQREHFWELPLYIESHMMPIVISVPPYHFWEPPPEEGPIPTHGSDFGLFIHAEVLGMKKLIVKDVDGLYDHDLERTPTPSSSRRRRWRRSIGLAEGAAHRQAALRRPRRTARHVERVQLVNGLRRGELTRALAGEEVGTVIDRGETRTAGRMI